MDIYFTFRSLDKEEAMEMMEVHDADGDGNVTWREYLKKVFDYLPEEVEDFEKDKNQQVRALGEVRAVWLLNCILYSILSVK